jgi:LPXTG-site transpeptidase (sortase) family protein
MSKKIFVLFVAVIFISSIIYIVVKDTKQIHEEMKIVEENFNDLGGDETQENIISIPEKNTDETYQELQNNEVTEYLEETQNENKYEEDTLGKIIIQKINLEANVKEGSTDDILEEYVGHIEETSKYSGNVGLAAHNRGYEHSYFSRLNELEIGDLIIYESIFGTRTYKVDFIKKILDTDWSMLEDTNENKITLITCINNKINLRLCVQATEI